MESSDLGAVERHLNSLINYEHAFPLGGPRDRPKLEPTLRAAARLELPLRLSSCVHVAGTKGKGSVVSFLESLLTPENPTLSFTSPHLTSFTERVRLNGNPLPTELWKQGFEAIVSALGREPAISLTYFEMTWIIFLWAAKELKTRFHLVEAGLGGRWDATNVLDNATAVLTSIDYDHTDVLGSTLTEIAADKAGIIKPGSPVIVGRQPEEALRVIQSAAVKCNVLPRYLGEDFGWATEPVGSFRYEDQQGSIENLALATPGLHQRDNACVAICIVRMLAPLLTPSQIRERLSSCVIPARQQLLRGTPDVLVDVAHNPVSFRALSETLRGQYGGRKILAVIGMMRNKDARASLASLQGLVGNVRLVEVNSPRTASPSELQEIARGLGLSATCSTSREDAFRELHQLDSCDLGLVAGSFYLAGDYLLWRRRAGIA